MSWRENARTAEMRRVELAAAEASRFLDTVGLFRATAYDTGPMPTRAAMKRASMDLTKALSALRRRES